MANEITRILSISTDSKRIEVNKHSIKDASQEIILYKNNRLYCTIWTVPRFTDGIIKEFLSTGQIANFTGLMVV
ncbi:hypothetical protein [Neisseria perflava]|uniref:hypothetical protein n=1 Tax=Neisseria perflava TaxID=33053 RepID=UPI00209C78E4|nr:hypothetical protein [Neisseria perflava]MCP1661304.1 hypothetical protein [Neisseria perflava]MCP1773399.1 hypothetical protein [Neisseria perflava]